MNLNSASLLEKFVIDLANVYSYFKEFEAPVAPSCVSKGNFSLFHNLCNNLPS